MIASRASVVLGALSVMAAACTAPRTVTPASTAPAPRAVELIAKMAATYRGATSYADRGTVTTMFSGGGRRVSSHKEFETALVRPNRFRFELRVDGDPQRAYVIWSDGPRTYTKWYATADVIDDGRDLGRALAAATGVSSGTATTIPRLLIPGVVRGTAVTDLKDLRLAGSEPIAGNACWKVTGIDARREPITLWIDQRTHLLRRMLTRTTTGDFDTEEVTTFDPIVNQVVAPSRLTAPEIAEGSVVEREAPSWVGVRFDGDSLDIIQVINGAPGERAGIRLGDRIVSVDGTVIASAADFIKRVKRTKSGHDLAVVVARGDKQERLTITVEERPESLAIHTLVDKPAPPFTATVLSGSSSAKLADLAGHVVIIDFWATWCGPCAITIPRLNELHAKYAARGLRIVGISNEEADVIRKFAADKQLAYTVAQDVDEKIAKDYMREGIPMFVVIDKAGVVRHVSVGADVDPLEAVVARLLK